MKPVILVNPVNPVNQLLVSSATNAFKTKGCTVDGDRLFIGRAYAASLEKLLELLSQSGCLKLTLDGAPREWLVYKQGLMTMLYTCIA